MSFANTSLSEGSEQNPIKVDSEYPFPVGGFDLPYGDRPYVWAVTPKGQMVKCYRSYSDYCDD